MAFYYLFLWQKSDPIFARRLGNLHHLRLLQSCSDSNDSKPIFFKFNNTWFPRIQQVKSRFASQNNLSVTWSDPRVQSVTHLSFSIPQKGLYFWDTLYILQFPSWSTSHCDKWLKLEGGPVEQMLACFSATSFLAWQCVNFTRKKLFRKPQSDNKNWHIRDKIAARGHHLGSGVSQKYGEKGKKGYMSVLSRS